MKKLFKFMASDFNNRNFSYFQKVTCVLGKGITVIRKYTKINAFSYRFVAIAILVLIVGCSQNPTGKVVYTKNNEVKEINVKAFQWEYSPDTINLNKGDKVKIIIDNTDVPHGINIPALDAQGENFVEFTANKAGSFDWYCLVPCGQGHTQMKGKIIVK